MKRLVSILVLMDAALRQKDRCKAETLDCCFNPCFDGCRPATPLRGEVRQSSLTVSILVLMDAALRPHDGNNVDFDDLKFQSLF